MTDKTDNRQWQKKLLKWAGAGRFPARESYRFRLHDFNLVPAALARICAHHKGSLLVVAPNSTASDQLTNTFSMYRKLIQEERPVIQIPEVDTERRQWVPENEAARCAALDAVLMKKEGIYVASIEVLLSETVRAGQFRQKIFQLRKGDSIAPEELCRRLVDLDYDNEYEVQQPGEFAHRGGIVDIYSPLYEAPVRLEFWGDEIDSMRFFQPDNQRSFQELEEIRVIPRGSAVLEPEEEERQPVREYFDASVPMILCSPDQIMAHLESYYSQEQAGLWRQYLEKASVLIHLLTEPGEEDTRENALPEMEVQALHLGEELAVAMAEFGDGAALWHWQQLRDSLRSWHGRKYQIVACCSGEGERQRFQEMLQEDPETAKLPVAIEDFELDSGLLFPDQKLVLLSDREIFGRQGKVRRRRPIQYRQDQAIRGLADLEDGVLAVHISHGICIYHGIKRTEAMGEIVEAIELEFADESRLYVPLDQAYLISRYMGGSKSTPSLSKLGGTAWTNSKNMAAEGAWDLAADLLRLEALREQAPGMAFKPQIEWERAFVSSFPYSETPDQHDAIEAVLRDMESEKPMDRLVCGDVGYGKTEVAMRAAFRAVMNGRQVAVLVPTTVLAQQHFQSFRERMAEFPVNIESVSRFRTRKEQSEILMKVELGEIDILIGTHRILQNDVHFANLGLLIIDEEQRFGVKHKQRLKSMRADVDILTMTATPIPRTLYFSLSGLRNLSTIMTAPVDRIPVSTIVAYYDKELIRQAILRELERQGQVFFLYNRVSSIYDFLRMLQELVPEAKFGVGHGQMKPSQLEKVMGDFIQHKYDVLLCTTIIESGIDIPNVNTIIIDRADRFGLSELYQLRGRVGRYHRQAYAYLLLPPMGVLPENARQRLQAIRRYTHLGAGFKLAMKDLEIRGAGNILGEEQSGHIAAVGFDLYCQLLKEAVARLEHREIPVMSQIPVDFDLLTYSLKEVPGKMQAGIPLCYIEEEPVRVECYKRLSQFMEEKEVDQFRQELQDRFGTLPSSVDLLTELYRVKVLARKLKLLRLHVRDSRLLMEDTSGLYKFNRQIPMLHGRDARQQLAETVEILRKRLAARQNPEPVHAASTVPPRAPAADSSRPLRKTLAAPAHGTPPEHDAGKSHWPRKQKTHPAGEHPRDAAGQDRTGKKHPDRKRTGKRYFQ